MALIVAVDGLPGCGKTTVIKMVMDDLRKRDLKVETIHIENVDYTHALRPIAKTYPIGNPVRIIINWALRLQQYDAIQAMSERADVIFADRFWGSTLAFDAYGNGVPHELLEWVGQYIKRQPDITLFFEAPIEVVRKRKEASTMIDTGFAERVKQGYQELADELSWVHVDATQEPMLVKECCLRIVLAYLLTNLLKGV